MGKPPELNHLVVLQKNGFLTGGGEFNQCQAIETTDEKKLKWDISYNG